MRLIHLSLGDFRNYGSLELPLGQGHHLLLGQNGEGKTNVLEAVHLLGTGGSQRASRDAVLVAHDAPGYRVGGRFESDRESRSLRVEVTYQKSGGKKIRIDKEPGRASDLLGAIKVVSFAPSDVELVQESAQVRRRFLDLIGCQLSPKYMTVLREYQRAIRQRNETLAKSFVYSRGKNGASLAREPWTDLVIEHGSELFRRRRHLVDQLSETLRDLSEDAYKGGGPLDVTYDPAVPWDGDDPRPAFEVALADSRDREEAVGYTTCGPHADDVNLKLGGRELRRFGSLGQQQLSAMFLKLAQADLVRTAVGASPILLVDEMFAVLDRQAAEEFLARVEGEGQIILATAQEGWLGELRDRHFHVHHVRAGAIESVTT
ncbi:MAG: DNA replication and repair protein RecF [Gemmatimonadota bacterium]|nr:MAG: DNA replication and repair protein RecF [Gemmatimonadota bacterium]